MGKERREGKGAHGKRRLKPRSEIHEKKIKRNMTIEREGDKRKGK